jgi:hypothetical protein
MSTVMAMLAGKKSANRRLAIAIVVLLTLEVALAVLGVIAPIEALLRGWLVVFAIWSTVPVGSLALLMIHRLTGGDWGWAAEPVLRPAAAMIPLVALGFVPVLVALPHIYPWAVDPSAIPADVARWYLNGPSFLVRSLIALGGWSLLAIMFVAGRGSRLLAALGLAFFGLTISLVAVDWYLSLEPHYVASTFAAMIAIQQLLAALAITAFLGAPTIDGKMAGDFGALLLATLLGVVYLEFMTFVVAWYGDLPEKAAWFLKRGSPGWIAVLLVALLVGACLPFGMLLVKAIRRSRRGLRVAGGLILVGIVLHMIWLLVPAFSLQAGSIVVACAGVAGLTGLSLFIGSALGSALGPPLEVRHAE